MGGTYRWEGAVEAQIRQAQERGEFDNLPGAGKPLPKRHSPEDDMWWIKDYVRREGLPAEALLPASLRLRRRIERLPADLDRLAGEPAVREMIDALNTEIRAWLRMPSGPPVALRPLDVDQVVRDWAARRAAPAAPDSAGPGTVAPTGRRRRWNPFRRRPG
ncbi:DUF1992 domain-containing protein [Plantactinospora sp. GCM10030261]|uniref:DnaJ family domain-containing protein n=1 Tax=Plantactinospora sp. GCM10030261 TaxID=3273420 RepID=UPI0036187789